MEVSSGPLIRGKTLKVGFEIQYTAEDGGNQQGRIVIVAVTEDQALSYPKGIIKNTKLMIEKGEFFSVSRYREVRAELGPIPAGQTVKSVEILIYKLSGEPLLRKTIQLQNESH